MCGCAYVGVGVDASADTVERQEVVTHPTAQAID